MHRLTEFLSRATERNVVDTESFVLRQLCPMNDDVCRNVSMSPIQSPFADFSKSQDLAHHQKRRLTQFTSGSKTKDRFARTPSKFTRVCSGEGVGEEGWRFHGTIYAKRIRQKKKHCRDHLNAHGTFHESFVSFRNLANQNAENQCARCDLWRKRRIPTWGTI